MLGERSSEIKKMKAFNFEDLSTPAFIVDLDVVKENWYIELAIFV